jgi:hypothetical protein
MFQNRIQASPAKGVIKLLSTIFGVLNIRFQQGRVGLRIIRVAVFLLLLAGSSGLHQVSAHPNSDQEKLQTPRKITWEIFSGRVSPYFEVTLSRELQEIEARLRDLPLSSKAAAQSEWPGAYTFQLHDQQKKRTRLISVCRSEIHVRDGKQECNYVDAKLLRKYLDELKGRHKLICEDGGPLP